ncbi:MAG: hypothetical protein P4M00_09880 [Azospirillaceae bacterium]|nr:hypothetical protein [Azospirillaceae bacterium]
MTGREAPRDQILGVIRDNRRLAPGALQHMIVYGPRGFGKSFLMRLVQIEIEHGRDDALAFVLLPEEQHNLTRNPHALLGYITAKLADRRQGTDQSWTGAMVPLAGSRSRCRRLAGGGRRAGGRTRRQLWHEARTGRGGGREFRHSDGHCVQGGRRPAAPAGWMMRPDNRVMLLATATGARAWRELDAFLDRRTDWLGHHSYWSMTPVGRAIANVGAAEGRAAGFEAAAGILSRLARRATIWPKSWLSPIIAAFAADCRDAGLLRDVAGLLDGTLSPDAPAHARLLAALADYKADAGRRDAVLARLDPDIALWLRRLGELADEEPPQPRKRRRPPS